jgi:hypothetical protein
MKVPARYPEAQDFVSAIAKPFDSEAGAKVVGPFGIEWSQAVKLDRDLEIYTIGAPSLGIGFTFKDQGLVFVDEGHGVGDGPFLLTHCGFWGHEDGHESYQGPLWKDLRFSDTVADAKAKLGAPTRVGRLDIHFWELRDFRLTIQWKSPDKVRVISYWMRLEGS